MYFGFMGDNQSENVSKLINKPRETPDGEILHRTGLPAALNRESDAGVKTTIICLSWQDTGDKQDNYAIMSAMLGRKTG